MFKIHHLAVDDTQHFGQRPKAEDYDGFIYLVVHGASADRDGTEEVHFILADTFVITVHRGPCRGPGRGPRPDPATAGPPAVNAPHIALVYLVIDQLVDSFFPMLDQFDSQIDELEDAILVQPTDAQLGTLFAMKRSLITVRKVITPERDMFASISSGVTELPGLTTEGQRYMRDIYDHLIRISDLVDGYRDLLSGVMDTHLSTVSNRLNVVMKQLTIIATVFLPLSFLTGFFGQNFSFLVGHITGRWPFYVFGIGLETGGGGRSPVPVPQAGVAGRPHELTAAGGAAGGGDPGLRGARHHHAPAGPVRHDGQHRGARQHRGDAEEASHRGHRDRRADGPDRQDRSHRADGEDRAGRVDARGSNRSSSPTSGTCRSVLGGCVPCGPVWNRWPGNGGPPHPVWVVTARPDGSTTYHRPPALVRACPVALPGALSGGQ